MNLGPDRRLNARPADLFSRLADHYDRFNTLASFGVDRWWRRRALRGLPRGGRVLDLGCGGGQMARLLSGRKTFCVGVDPDFAMLEQGVRRGRAFLPVQATGESLPFRDRTWDGVVSAFVMRNLADIPAALAECRRVLRPGGYLVALDFFPSQRRIVRNFFRLYLNGVVPLVYGLLGGKRADAAWLHRSIAEFMTPQRFRSLVAACGFARVQIRPLLFGIAWRLQAWRD